MKSLLSDFTRKYIVDLLFSYSESSDTYKLFFPSLIPYLDYSNSLHLTCIKNFCIAFDKIPFIPKAQSNPFDFIKDPSSNTNEEYYLLNIRELFNGFTNKLRFNENLDYTLFNELNEILANHLTWNFFSMWDKSRFDIVQDTPILRNYKNIVLEEFNKFTVLNEFITKIIICWRI